MIKFEKFLKNGALAFGEDWTCIGWDSRSDIGIWLTLCGHIVGWGIPRVNDCNQCLTFYGKYPI